MVKLFYKLAIVLARNKRQGQIEAMIVRCSKFELSWGQTTKLTIWSGGKGMINQRKDCIRSPTMNQAFIVD